MLWGNPIKFMICLASMHIFFTSYSESDFFGKLIFLGLFALSVICWVVLIQKFWMLRKVKALSNAFLEAFEKNREQLLHLELSALPQAESPNLPHPLAQIFFSLKQKTHDILDKNLFFASQETKTGKPSAYLSETDLELVESHVLTTISTLNKRLEKNVFVLSTIVTLAPFLGLLGTVWGILLTFSELQSGASVSSNSAILAGLSTALVTTVLGLLIAIPALVAYNYLKNSLRTYSSDMEDFLYQLLSSLELQYRKADV